MKLAQEPFKKTSLGKREGSDEKITKSDKGEMGCNQVSDASDQNYLFFPIICVIAHIEIKGCGCFRGALSFSVFENLSKIVAK